MNSHFNTSKTDPLLLLADAMGPGGSGASIERMEAQGQRELVNSETIPARGSDALAEIGVSLGEVAADDPMFRKAVLPAGWRREASDHSMWSYVVDELGRRRISMFYKAAFYDRDAFCRMETVYSYLLTCLYEDREPVLDDVWATREAVAEALEGERREAQESLDLWADRTEDYAAEYADEARARLIKISEFAAKLSGCAA